MQIVIDIPEEWFNRLQDAWGWALAENVREAIKSGTTLPKGHGRLIDADALKLTQHDIHVESINYRHRCISVENVDEAQTIIEADKEVDDEEE